MWQINDPPQIIHYPHWRSQWDISSSFELNYALRPQNSYVEKLIPKVIMFGDLESWEATVFIGSHESGVLVVRLVSSSSMSFLMSFQPSLNFRSSNTVLHRTCECEHIKRIPEPRKKQSIFWLVQLLGLMLLIDFHRCHFVRLSKLSHFHSFHRMFITNECWVLANEFSAFLRQSHDFSLWWITLIDI